MQFCPKALTDSNTGKTNIPPSKTEGYWTFKRGEPCLVECYYPAASISALTRSRKARSC